MLLQSLDRLCAPEGVHHWQKAHRIYIFVIIHSEIEQSTDDDSQQHHL